jgi:CDP-glucose 4,6-dehydratase
VLDPLSGYLRLGSELLGSTKLHGESFNFGPGQEVNKTVKELIETFLSHWGKGSWRQLESDSTKSENVLLKLSCDKALHRLGWRTALSFEDAVRLTAQWYRSFYDAHDDMYEYSCNQIDYYVAEASRKKLSWIKET